MASPGRPAATAGRTAWVPPPAPFARPRAPTLVLGLGNPILGDDGVGWRVAEALAEEPVVAAARAAGRLELDCAALGGLALMERLLGYRQALVVDAVLTGTAPPGTVTRCPLEALPNPGAGHTTSAHDTSLATALALGRALGAPLPAVVTVVAVEARDVADFSERLSAPVAAALPRAVQLLLEALTTLEEDRPDGIA